MAGPAATAHALDRAIAARDCRSFWPLVLTSLRPAGTRPGAPATAAECGRAGAASVRRLHGFRLARVRAYGTAALAEGAIPRTGAFTTGELVLVLDRDGRYRLAEPLPARPQVGTAADRGAAAVADRVAGRFVSALRSGDCDEVVALADPAGSLRRSFGRRRAALCASLLRPGHLRPQLRTDRRARSVRQGATRDLAFYGIATTRGYWVLMLARRPPGAAPRVEDYWASVPGER